MSDETHIDAAIDAEERASERAKAAWILGPLGAGARHAREAARLRAWAAFLTGLPVASPEPQSSPGAADPSPATRGDAPA